MTIDFENKKQTLSPELDGTYGRVYIKNSVDGCVLDLGHQILNSKKPVLINNCEALTIQDGTIIGGMQVAGDISILILKKLKVLYGEHGLHMTQHTGKEVYGSVYIHSCSFKYQSKEGIYIGKFNGEAPQIKRVSIYDTTVSHCGWDGCQVGNTQMVNMVNCDFYDNANSEMWGQNFNLTINPNCNIVKLTGVNFHNRAQILSQKVFMYA